MPESLSVLLIDDDELSREVIELHLAAVGHIALPAEDGLAALALVQTLPAPPSLLLSDLHMPGPTGPALLALLHPHLAPDTPAIAMSGSHPPPELIVGYNAFLLKPFTVDQLLDAIRTAQQDAIDLPSTPESLMSPHLASQTLTPAVLPSLTADAGTEDRKIRADPANPDYILDPAIFDQLVDMLRTEQLVELFHLSFGELEKHLRRMHEALAANDSAAFRHSAHTVKGSFAIVGARELQELGATLEAGAGSPADHRATLQQIPLAAGRLRGMLSRRGIHLEHHPSPGQEFA